MITTIFMDLDETLLDFRRAERCCLLAALEAMGIPAGEKTASLYANLNRACWLRLEAGTLTRTALRSERFRLLLSAMDSGADADELAEAYESRLSEAGALLPGAQETMDALYGKYRLYAVTNGFARTQHGRLRASGLDKYFDGVFISQEIGADKPTRAYFEAVFSKIPDFSKAETVLLGDSLTSDIAGGIAAGLTTVWLNAHGADPGSVRPDYTISDIALFPALLSRL